MQNITRMKVLVLIIIVFFIVAGVLPSAISINKEGYSPTDEKAALMGIIPRGNILYVGGSGTGNYTSIQSALNDAVDGDTVFVYDDSSPYNENVVVNKSINLIGEDKNTTIIFGVEYESYVIIIGANWVNISEFTIQNSQSGIGSFGDNITISSNIILYCNTGLVSSGHIKNTYFNNYISNCDYGILMHPWGGHSSDNSILNNTFINISIWGICVDTSMNNDISYNIFSNCYNAIQVFGSAYNSISGNIILNNFEGINMAGYVNNSIIGNTIKYNNYGITLSGTNNSIIGNTIKYNNYGITLSGTDYISVIDNNISNNNEYGISLISQKNGLISNNIITTNNEGIILYNSDENIFKNNTIIENDLIGVIIEWSNNNYIENNNITLNEEEGIYLIRSNNNLIKYNNISYNENGIELEDSNYNIISKNRINLNHNHGIELIASSSSLCHDNIIISNTIKSNNQGIYLENSSNNNMEKNNFLKNIQYGQFINCTNSWYQNYWNRPRILPKLIFGKMELGSIEIPWINIDWRPALKPYDI